MRHLFIGAHPDDIEFSCAGTISKLIAIEDEVGCIVMGAGEHSDAENNSERSADQWAVWNFLGIEYGKILDFADGYMHENKSMVSAIAERIREFNPDVVYVHDPNDRHQDHRAVANAVISACGTYWNLVFYDSYSSTGFAPNVFVVIDEYIDQKQEALKLFRSEMEKYKKRGKPFDDSALRRSARHGHDAECGHAEGFRVARCVID